MALSAVPSIHPASLAELARPVAAHMRQVEQRLEAFVPRDIGGLAPLAYQHALKAGGKRLRPILTLLSCGAAGGEVEEAVGLATAVEVIHLSSLIHDDVIDEAEQRRGKASVPGRWGNRASILVGDFLIAEIFRRLVDEFGRMALTVLAESIVSMCCAELSDDGPNAWPSEDAYFRNIRGKTAALMSASCEIGAIAAQNPSLSNALREYGLNLGLAFQVTDDLLDLYGNPEVLGKPIRQDLVRGQWTLPVIAALDLASPEQRAELQDLLDRLAAGETELAEEAAKMMQVLGGRGHAEERSAQLIKDAHQALEPLPNSPSCASLHGIADYVIRRCA